MAQKWSDSTTVEPPRSALTERRLMETIDRERGNAALARRVGVLAAIHVAEWPRLRYRFGPEAEHVVTAALEGLVARGGESPEHHSPRTGGGFWILLPETGFYAAHQRLRQLSLQVTETVIDVLGERLRVTPVIGYATFADATSAPELCEHASAALHEAFRSLEPVPVKYSRAVAITAYKSASQDRLMRLIEKSWAPLRIGFILSLLLEVPFIAYVLSWRSGFDLTTVTYPLLGVGLAGSAIAAWIASFRVASGSIENLGMVAPDTALEPGREYPPATAIVVASLSSESVMIADTVTSLLEHDYPGDFQVILTFDAPAELPIQDSLDDLAETDPRLMCLRMGAGTSKAECVSAALPHVRGEFVGIFDADNHLEQGSFSRAWRWLCNGHDIVQGHRLVRNGEMSWVTRLVAVDYERAQALSDQDRGELDAFGIFGGSSTYWRADALMYTASKGSMPLKEIRSSERRLQDAFAFASDPMLLSTELAPTTLRALWRQRVCWARARASARDHARTRDRARAETVDRHLRSTAAERRVTTHQQVGRRTLRLGWIQTIPWLSLQVIPIVGFVVWRDDGFGKLNDLIPLLALLVFFMFSVGVAQGALGYLLANPRIKRHRPWFVTYAFHSAVWFGEFKDLIGRLARFKGAVGETLLVKTGTERVRPFSERPPERAPDFALNDHESSGGQTDRSSQAEPVGWASDMTSDVPPQRFHERVFEVKELRREQIALHRRSGAKRLTGVSGSEGTSGAPDTPSGEPSARSPWLPG